MHAGLKLARRVEETQSPGEMRARLSGLEYCLAGSSSELRKSNDAARFGSRGGVEIFRRARERQLIRAGIVKHGGSDQDACRIAAQRKVEGRREFACCHLARCHLAYCLAYLLTIAIA